MKKIKNFIRSIAPKIMLEGFRSFKKRKRNKAIQHQKSANTGLSKAALMAQLKKIGIQNEDVLLVHSSLSKIGYVDGGPKTIVEALIETVGENGHVLMPTSPNNHLQLEYIQNLSVFDVLNSPSKLGAITEFFRTYSNVKRSLHPTEPVSCWGKEKDYFVDGHFNQITPYNKNSPFYKVAEKNGKILMIGVTLDNAGTNLHCLEDLVDFKFPVYYKDIFEVSIKDEHGKTQQIKTKVHNPIWSKKRKCDELIPLFEKQNVLTKVKIGNANTLLIDAKKMIDTMIDLYHSKGVTMYTPHGS